MAPPPPRPAGVMKSGGAPASLPLLQTPTVSHHAATLSRHHRPGLSPQSIRCSDGERRTGHERAASARARPHGLHNVTAIGVLHHVRGWRAARTSSIQATTPFSTPAIASSSLA
ncbi:hypothetical protein PR202_gb23911 [Eleusine coracana subsp. coracana]|uniref:Uncharacterized protein n=1 Tax=Eleusine coracana subsp. coracana TaxID=191504 RepID=A0AAV5FK28_ELECO|nr:hypothetical protein PR202_gb23911 [Eleusine coracana subsp. coracana]